MIPLERPRVVGATFPYVGLAVAVLALYAIVAVTIPPNLYRSAIAVAAFFAMGYCALAIIGALGVFISIAGIGYPDPHTAALGIDGPYGSGGTLDPLPYTFVRGTAHRIVVTVLGNATPGSFGVRIRLVPLNATGTEPFHSVPTTFPLALDEFAEHRDSITVAAEGRWTNLYSIAIDPVGNFTLRFDLLDSSNRAIAGAHLPIQTTDPPMVSARMAMTVGIDVRGARVGSGLLRSGDDLID